MTNAIRQGFLDSNQTLTKSFLLGYVDSDLATKVPYDGPFVNAFWDSSQFCA